MTNQRKPNLVLTNAFLTNSLILKGLIDYLGRHFEVHFIDLPGFRADIAPLPEISLERFARYVEERLDGLGLDDYLLGGLSFGFSVISQLCLDEKCRGIIGIAPFAGSRFLALGRMKKSVYRVLVELTLKLKLSDEVWSDHRFRRFFHWYSDYPSERIDILLNEMDGGTFFKTARIILTHSQPLPFQRVPHVLILSERDRTVDNELLIKVFQQRVEQLKVLWLDIDHYPVVLSAEYFMDRFPEEKVRDIVSFFEMSRRVPAPES